MDKIFLVCIIVTLLGFVASKVNPSVEAFLSELTKINDNCEDSSSSHVTNLCPTEKAEVDPQSHANNLTEACKKLQDYETCVTSTCDNIQALSSSITLMKTKCELNPSVKALLDELTKMDDNCKDSTGVVTDPCSADKDQMDTHLDGNSLTEACRKLPDYTSCLPTVCTNTADLTKYIDTMEEECAIPDFLDVLSIIDSQCTKSNNPVTNPCATEKNKVDTQLQADSLTEACKKLPDYKSCLLTDCDKTADLIKSIDTMEEKCPSGFMKISVSMLTLFLAAIVNFL